MSTDHTTRGNDSERIELRSFMYIIDRDADPPNLWISGYGVYLDDVR